MSETPKTPDTNDSSSESSSPKPRGGRPKKNTEPAHTPIFPKEEPKQERGQVVDVKNLHKLSPEVHQQNLKIASEIVELEANVAYCIAAKIEWLEVSPELLMHFCGGVLPDCGYYIYKNVRLCRKDTAEGIAEKENMTCHQVLFPDEGYMKVR